MSHLTTETLARLVDEPATEPELAHLTSCGRCRGTLDELRAQTEALGALPSHAPPGPAWDGIAARLRDDHLRRSRLRANLLRVAAAVGFIAIGAAGQALFSGRGEPVAISAGGSAFAPESLTANLVSSPAPKS